MLTSRGLGTVLGDLASMGFDARWGVLGAADVGANHQRDRIWIVGKATNSTSIGSYNKENKRIMEGEGWSELQSKQSRHSSEMAYSSELFSNGGNINRQGGSIPELGNSYGAYGQNDSWWKTEPNVGRVVDGLADRVDRLKAIGNGQVPLCAATAWRILSKDL
jgi:DNA (cytosine-5)-methyltransferase 1